MGFLDHSTNNIIIDAVLTDYGRKLLAENQGAFKIAFFSLADDEVDYTTIRKFGRTVGKEKISKNTPVYEAQTLASSAMKHRLITLPDPILSRLPNLTLVSSQGTGVSTSDDLSTVIMDSNANIARIEFKQSTPEATVPTGMLDSTYTVFVNDRFLELTNSSNSEAQSSSTSNIIDVDPYSKVASYQVAGAIETDDNKSLSTVTIRVGRRNPGTSAWNQYGDYGANGTRFTSIVSVVGDQSGLRKDIKLILNRNNN